MVQLVTKSPGLLLDTLDRHGLLPDRAGGEAGPDDLLTLDTWHLTRHLTPDCPPGAAPGGAARAVAPVRP